MVSSSTCDTFTEYHCYESTNIYLYNNRVTLSAASPTLFSSLSGPPFCPTTVFVITKATGVTLFPSSVPSPRRHRFAQSRDRFFYSFSVALEAHCLIWLNLHRRPETGSTVAFGASPKSSAFGGSTMTSEALTLLEPAGRSKFDNGNGSISASA